MRGYEREERLVLSNLHYIMSWTLPHIQKKDSATKQEHTILFNSSWTFRLAEVWFYRG
ncbi:MAG: hypothetical protein ACI93L_003428 [Cyclobacteriaceae bacterium]|jgi:hypothetical protein